MAKIRIADYVKPTKPVYQKHNFEQYLAAVQRLANSRPGKRPSIAGMSLHDAFKSGMTPAEVLASVATTG